MQSLRRFCATNAVAAARRTFCVGITTLRLQGAQRKTEEESDFVDIDFLAMGVTAAGGEGSVSRSTSLPSSSITVTVKDAQRNAGEEVLGVTRRAMEKAGTEYSRFHLPLETPRGGKPIPRLNSRAAFTPGEEARLAEEESIAKVQKATDAEKDGESNTDEDAPADVALALTNALVADADGSNEALTANAAFNPLPPATDTTLPFDDDAFAETLLQMEVDGVIDEAWQDTRKAHLEDVKEIKEILQSLKVRDICCIDVSAKTGNFDYMLFGTCEGPRHIHLAAWAAQEADSLKRVSKIPRRKTDELWEVVPIGRIVLNLMVESLREDLTLERKWAVTKNMDPLQMANAPVSEGRNVRAHGLWTLTLNLQDLEDFEVDYCKDVLLRQS